MELPKHGFQRFWDNMLFHWFLLVWNCLVWVYASLKSSSWRQLFYIYILFHTGMLFLSKLTTWTHTNTTHHTTCTHMGAQSFEGDKKGNWNKETEWISPKERKPSTLNCCQTQSIQLLQPWSLFIHFWAWFVDLWHQIIQMRTRKSRRAVQEQSCSMEETEAPEGCQVPHTAGV